MMIMAKTGMGDPYVENDGLVIWLAFPLGILIAALAGAFNGFLVTKFRLPPFIVTLGTLNIFVAITILYASGRSVLENEIDPFLLELSKIFKMGDFVITYGVILMLLMYAFFAYNLRFTSWGRHIYAVGNDPEAARLSGISVNKVLISAYLVAGLIFGLTSWIMIGRIMVASPNVPADYNLVAITAVVIGGTSLFGGRGTVFGTLIGACIVGVFQNGLTLAGVDLNYQLLAIGILIIFAVTLDTWVRRVKF
jgi:fructose transport system permease protein